MNIGQQIERALVQQDRQRGNAGGLRQVNIARARVLDALGVQPPLVEYLTQPYLMDNGERLNLPTCYMDERGPTRKQLSFDAWSPWLAVAVDYVSRSVAEVEAKSQYCAKHGIKYCHIGDAKLDMVCDTLRMVADERRAVRGLEKVEKTVESRRGIVLGSRNRVDPDYPNG